MFYEYTCFEGILKPLVKLYEQSRTRELSIFQNNIEQ